MNHTSTSSKDPDKKWPRWELLLLLLTLLGSMCCICGSTEVALGFWPEWVSSSLLSAREADYTGGPGGPRFAVFDPQVDAEAATDIARLQITPTGDEGGRAVMILPLPTPLTTTTGTEPSPSPPAAGSVTPATPATAVSRTPTAAAGVRLTAGATGRPTAQPTPTPGPGLPAATLAPPPASPLPPPTNTPVPDDDDDDDDGGNGGGNPSPPATDTPVPASTATNTPVPGLTPTATPVPVTVLLSGRVFEDTNYSGGAGTAFGGGDAGLPNVTVELYDGSTWLASTSTDGTGAYAFPDAPGSGTLTVRVVSFTMGDADTPPAAGFNGGFTTALAEQTYEHDGAAGAGGAGALGGNDPLVDDTATAAGAGPGDTNVTVTMAGVDVTGVEFGFAFNLTANTNDTGQGSLRQALANANAVAGMDTIVFNIAGGRPYTIRPNPALPEITDPVVIDGTTQPGFAGTPVVELDGSLATGPNAGLTISAGDSTVRGLVINRFGTGLTLTGGGNNVIAGNYIGLDPTGGVASGNAINIDVAGSSNNRIGGPAAADRNVVAGGSSFEIRLSGGANGNSLQGNYIGLDAAGAAALGVGTGVAIYDSANNQIGGPAAADRNVISTGGNVGLYLTGSSPGTIIQGNYLGTDAAGAAALGNLRGIQINDGPQNTTIGGTTAGAGNLIAHSSAAGISLNDFSSSQGITIRGNSIYANGGLGLDLGADGPTANDNGDGDIGPNGRFNFPVIDSAIIDGGDITVAGYARPGSIIEFFRADADPSGFGEGQTYVATFTEGAAADTDNTTGSYNLGPVIGQDATNRFSFTFPAGALALGDKLTATATDAAGNTSEFGPNVTVSLPLQVQVSGRVFEDVDYSGGTGTAFGGGDAGLPNVTVELYDGPTLLDSVVTDGTGAYTFPTVPDGGTFTVRAVSASIGDADTPPTAGFNGGFTTALAEQTYEDDGAAGNGGAGALGGNDPLADDTTTAAAAGPGDTNVVITTAGVDVTGVELGFVFNLVANTNNTGQGSLRRAMDNANAVAGTDTLVFNIAGGGPYTILPNPALPQITDPVVIDGTTQPGFAGAPLIEVDGASIASDHLVISAGASTIRGLVINNFDRAIELTTNGNNIIQGNYIGTDVAGAVSKDNLFGVYINTGSSNNQIGGTTPADRNVIAGNQGNIFILGDNNVIQGNYIGVDAAGTTALGQGSGISVRSNGNIIGGTTPAAGNVIAGHTSWNISFGSSASANSVQNNLIGVDASGLNPLSSDGGIFFTGGANSNQIGDAAAGTGNIIAFSGSTGLLLASGAGNNNRISGNSIFGNTALGIDLDDDGVTLNDPGDGDTGPNDLVNFPVIDSAIIAGGNITVTGYARPGSVIEFFVAGPDPSGFGEGQTYLATFTEGGAADADNTTGGYGPGPAGQDTTNRFSFTFLAGPVVAGDELTATATDATGNTSEFGPNATVSLPASVQISGRIFEDVNYSGGAGTAFGGGDAGLPNVTVDLYNGPTLLDSAVTDGTGAYTFTNVPDGGTYTVRAVSASIGDADTPPTAGFNGGFTTALAEQTYEHDGTAGNGGAGALGGNDPLVDDTATAAGAGAGDTNVTVTTAGIDVAGVELGFAFNLTANTANTGQGSLRQAIDNANAVVGTDTLVFNIAGGGPYTIQPNPALPEIIDPVVIDGTTQPGFGGSPIVEIDGSNVTTASGLTISAGNSTVRGLVINRVAGWAGIEVQGDGNNVIQGNYLGVDVTGTAVLANTGSGIFISTGCASGGNTIGGPTAADRNLISGNGYGGVTIQFCDNNVIQGNYIGTDITGMTALPNSGEGVYTEASSNNLIGGTTPGAGNLISANTSDGLSIWGFNGDNNVIQGNYIGTDIGGTPTLGNGGHGIEFETAATDNTVEAGNIIAGNGGHGVNIFSGSRNAVLTNTIYANGGDGIYLQSGTEGTFRANTIFDNGELGIDLALDGVTANDNGDGDTGPNDLFNFPVIEDAILSGGDITIAGYARPGSILEFFIADPDPSGLGEGRTYVATFSEGSANDTDNTAGAYNLGPTIGQDTANRFSFTFPAGPVVAGDELTATATDASGNTSEFGPNATVSLPASVEISGRIFEDVNYSGGAGTAFGGGDAGLPNVIVELYDGPTLLDSVATDATGAYTFTNAPNSGTFTVRAVSASIGDADTPPTAGLNGAAVVLAEQTYEYDGAAGNGGAGALGGNDPLVDDTATAAGAGTGDTNVTVTTAGLDVAGVDLGFAFNLTANTNDAGQGSLRQAIANANAVAGTDGIVFNIAGPAPYTIQPVSPLPEITDPTVIDGRSQPGFSGSPLVELDGTNITGSNGGLKISAGNSAVRGLVINRFTDWAAIELNGNGNNVVGGCYLGLDATGTVALSNLTGLYMTNGSANNQIGGTTPADRNVISGNQNFNIFTDSGAAGNVIIGNYIGPDAAGTGPLGGGVGVAFESGGNLLGGLSPGEGNVISGNGNRGVLLNSNAAGNVIQGNLIGLDGSGLNPLGNSTGVYLINGANNNLIEANTIAHSTPNAGVLLGSTAGDNNRISGNSIFANGGLGIDLNPGGVNPNDAGDGDGGPNTGFNFPVIEDATLSGGNLTVTGYARPGSIIEFFIADADALDFGEGQTYLATFTEGGAADADGTAGSYTDPLAGSDTTNRFSFTFPAGPVVIGDELTATATDASGNTSEFSRNFTVN